MNQADNPAGPEPIASAAPGKAGAEPPAAGRGEAVSLHDWLVRMIWLSMLPMLLVAGGLAYDSLSTQRDEIRQEGGHLAQVIATGIDNALHARASSLLVLAASPDLDDPARWREHFRLGQAYQERFGSRVILADTGAPPRMLYNTALAFGSPLPALPRPAANSAVATALTSGKPAVGDIVRGNISLGPMVAIAVPVQREARIPFILLTAIETRFFQTRLDQLPLPAGYAVSLIDGSGQQIARSAPAAAGPGAEFDDAERFSVLSREGPWTLTLEIPRRIFHEPLVELALGLSGLLLVGIVGSVVVGWRGSRQLSRVVTALARPHDDGQSGEIALPPSIAEVDAVRLRLDQAAAIAAASEFALRGSEERFRTLFEQAPLGINIVGRDGLSIHSNPAVLRLLGYSAEELGRLHMTEMTHPDDREASSRLVMQVVARPAENLSIDKRYLRKDGGIVWSHTSVAAVCAADGAVKYFIVMIEDIGARVAAEATLGRSAAQLHALTARLQAVREEERTGLAREVHDELGQMLTGLTMDMAWLRMRLQKSGDVALREAMSLKFAEITELTDAMIRNVQEIASELRPSVLDNLGLGAALRFEAARFQRRSGIACATEMPEMTVVLDRERATALFRVAQEILTNVYRHAGASKVNVRLAETADEVVLEVRDNGRGMPRALADAGSLGLLGMRERMAAIGGGIEFSGEAGQGTTVTARVKR